MKKKICLVVISCLIFLVTGCTSDASVEESDRISKVLIKNNILSKSEKVIDTEIYASCMEGYYSTTYYIHEDKNGKLKAINYRKISKSERKTEKCDFKVKVYNNISLNPDYYEKENNSYCDTDNHKYDIEGESKEYCIKEYNFGLFKTYKLKK